MRNSILKAFSLGMVTGSFATAGMVLLATPAKADPDPVAYSYAAENGSAVCYTLDEYPSENGILGIGQAIIEDGLTAYQAGEVVYYSVAELCPRHMDLILSFAAGGEMVA